VGRKSGPSVRSKGRLASASTFSRAATVARFLREGAEILERQGQSRRGPDDLHGLAFGRGEGGAQHLVTANDLAEGACSIASTFERPAEAQADGDVVKEAVRLELREEPQALLRERELERAIPRGRG
jgi:hypothetical protein